MTAFINTGISFFTLFWGGRSDSCGLEQDNCQLPVPKFLSLSEGSSILRYRLVFRGGNGPWPKKADSYMIAIEHNGVEPDMPTSAKGIADGFPISAFTARADVGGAFAPGYFLSIFGGNPVSCAAALVTELLTSNYRQPN